MSRPSRPSPAIADPVLRALARLGGLHRAARELADADAPAAVEDDEEEGLRVAAQGAAVGRSFAVGPYVFHLLEGVIFQIAGPGGVSVHTGSGLAPLGSEGRRWEVAPHEALRFTDAAGHQWVAEESVSR